MAPPQGQYAPPPPGYESQGAVYDDRAQRADRDYAERYSRWAQQYCVDRRDNHTAAGAIIGGILGAVIGSNVSGRHSRTGGSIIGGALGATAGAAIGANSAESAECPPGYFIRTGAPGFAYGPPPPYGPAWYNPWFFEGGVWVYRPYRYWYWTHDAYWSPGWRPGPWEYRYRRW
ncbi:MAG: glycine zipper 2TM domain-containing protein [Phenylobacterium sp.]|nr:MAG: glycine zipper 2TM domain-containing protein [Phenylobacterium sp.]